MCDSRQENRPRSACSSWKHCSSPKQCSNRKTRVLFGLLIGVLSSVSPATAPAQSLASQIAAAAAESSEQVDSSAIADLEPAQTEFLTAIDQLRSHLAATTTDANAQAWMNYLKVDSVDDLIRSNPDDSDLVTRSAIIAQQATGIHPGLEVPAVRNLRAAAERYSDALRFRSKDNVANLLTQLLDRSAAEWAEIGDNPSPEEIATLRLLLDLLQRTNQSVAIVERSQELFSSTNFHVAINESLVQRIANRQVHECSAVRECILGTRIVGNALLTGNVTTTLLPSIGSVRLQIALDGNVSTVNKGYNGPVRLRTSGSGQVHATRNMSVDESGFRFEPVVVDGGMNTRINAIEHPLRLVRRIAKKKAAQQKPLADRIAHQKFIKRITEEFTEETEQAVSKPMPDLMAEARPFLQRLDLPEPTRTIGSTDDSVFAYATIRKGNQLSAPSPPPPIPVSNEATVQIHESLIDNTLGTLLAGRTLTRTELQDLAGKLKRDDQQDQVSQSEVAASEVAEGDEEEEPEFEIDFHSSRPIIFEARDGKLRVGIQGTRFAQGSRELKKRLEIVAEYEPIETESGEIRLQRVGETQINFPGTKRLSVAQAGLRGSIKKGFADAFPEVLMDKAWILPADVDAPALRGRNFRPRYFDAQNGWLTLGVSS